MASFGADRGSLSAATMKATAGLMSGSGRLHLTLRPKKQNI